MKNAVSKGGEIVEQLQIGKIKSTDLANWFGYSYSTYRKKKTILLEYLKDYCEYTEVYGGIIVTEIRFEKYEGDLSSDVQVYHAQVKKNHLNSISNIADAIADEPQYKHLSHSQRERRMSHAGEVGYGITVEEDSKGIYGTRNYQWSIKLYDEDEPYRSLTEEEQAIFDEYTIAVFGKHPEVVQRLKLLDETFEKTDMTKEEYLKHKDRLEFKKTFDKVIFKFKEETGLQLVRATDHQEFNEEGAWEE